MLRTSKISSRNGDALETIRIVLKCVSSLFHLNFYLRIQA